MTTENQAKTPSVKTFQAGEVIFHDGDLADSLFIIQKGQLRLYKPKGNGFIEIGVLRSGEVIGEMAYFSDDEASKRRSCSAAALVSTELLTIPFSIFDKKMNSQEPWFLKIITNLVDRLRKSNVRVKELEDKQTTHYGKSADSYEFIKPHDIIKILGTIFIVAKSHAESTPAGIKLGIKILDFYAKDIYQITESKFEVVISLLEELGYAQVLKESSKETIVESLLIKDLDLLKQIFIRYSAERTMSESQKINFTPKAEAILKEVIAESASISEAIADIKKDGEMVKPTFSHKLFLDDIFKGLESKGMIVSYADLEEGRELKMFGTAFEDKGKQYIETNLELVKKLYPIIAFKNALKKKLS